MRAREHIEFAGDQSRRGARRPSRHSRTIAIALALALAGPGRALAAVFDCASGDVACLIAAINAANQNPDADTIELAAGTYTLTTPDNGGPFAANGLPIIATPITIQGAGPTATVIQRSPDPSTPFFRILQVAVSGNLTLDSLTIQNGDMTSADGGIGILNLGTTTVSNSAVLHNTEEGGFGGAGIMSPGPLALIGSRVENNVALDSVGGGITSSGGLTITGSVIRSNGGIFCGGLTISGTATITNSTIAQNEAFGSGGGLCLGGSVDINDSAIVNNAAVGDFAQGGGIDNGGILHINSSTVANNNALGGLTDSGGGIHNTGTIQVNNSTVADNHEECQPDCGGFGGGIGNDGGTVEIQNTILAGNTVGATGPPPPVPGVGPDCHGVVSSLGHNIVGDTSGCTIALLGSDHTGDPGLDVFQDDGTPGNAHLPLLATSPAVDAGDAGSCTATDQLGHVRVDGNGDGIVVCDIGAVEFVPPEPSTVVIDGCDSGVPNVVLSDGRTILDRILDCAAGAGNHGAFVSCVSHLTDELKGEGIITAAQKGSIMACAGEARIP